MIADNLKHVRQRIAKCCEKAGRSAKDVELVCVTKEASLDEIQEVLALGVHALGENRIQDAIAKRRVIGDRAKWHLVGHLQTNKVKDAVSMFSLIHSVDSVRLAEAIDREAEKAHKVQDILVQVNTSGEKTTFGVTPEALKVFLKDISIYSNIMILGLMTIAPEFENPELARPCFQKLRILRDKINNLQLLSMGMSNDFEVAIEEGSNMVRVGRAIFNPKP